MATELQLTMDQDTTVPTLYQQANDVMARFNFDRVLHTMHLTNWRWRGEVVTRDGLVSNAVYLLDAVIRNYEHNDNGWAEVATGGFVARVDKTTWGPRLSLAFTVESVDARMD